MVNPHSLTGLNKVLDPSLIALTSPRRGHTLQQLPMMNVVLFEAILLNNEAVGQLKAGNTVEAIAMFQCALVTMKLSVVDREHTTGKLSIDRTEWPEPPNRPATGSTNSACDHCCDRKGGTIYFYGRPMLLSTTELAVDPIQNDSFIRVQINSTCMVFNLALAYHHLGIETGMDEPYRHALKLYQIVLTCQNVDPFVDDETRVALQVIHCVVLNNLSHLHYELCEYSNSVHCMDCMAEWASQTECLEHSSFLHEDEAEEIKLNHIFTHFPVTAHAA
jgi:hypothetical protein